MHCRLKNPYTKLFSRIAWPSWVLLPSVIGPRLAGFASPSGLTAQWHLSCEAQRVRPKPQSWTPAFRALLKCTCFVLKTPTLEESGRAVNRPQLPGGCRGQALHRELTLCPSQEQIVIWLGTKPLPWRSQLSWNLTRALRATFPSQSFSQEGIRLLLEGFAVWDDVFKDGFCSASQELDDSLQLLLLCSILSDQMRDYWWLC